MEGIIDKSIDQDYEDGESFALLNIRYAIHYVKSEYWDDHWLIQTNTEKYFMCKDSEKL